MLARGDGRKSVMPSLLEIVLRDRAGQPGLAERLQLLAEAFRECSCADAGRVKALDDLYGGIDERRRLCAVRVRDQAAPNNPQENVM